MQSSFRIGLISDTHGLLRPEALEALNGADHIIHAGDIGAPGIVEALSALAPTTAIRGNIDRNTWASLYPETKSLRLAGVSIHVVHALADLKQATLPPEISVVVFGHSHRAKIETRDGLLLFNPGSAGPRRFKLPASVASLSIVDDDLQPQIHVLAV
jgi:putative phosphoesterase